MHCAGCGHEQEAPSESCPRCATPWVGAWFRETVELPITLGVPTPDRCCCCLEPGGLLRKEKIPIPFEVRDGAFRQSHLLVAVPWCRRCRNRRTHLFVTTLTCFIVFSVAALYGVAVLHHGEMTGPLLMVGIALGGIASGLARAGLKALLPARPGHVRYCLAFEGGVPIPSPEAGKGTIRLSFRNKAFSAHWNALLSPPTKLPPSGIPEVRRKLLESCDALHQKAMERRDSNHRATQDIREGILRGRGVIESVPERFDQVSAYLNEIRDRLEQERATLSGRADDEDGWCLGGLRSVMNKVDELAGR